MRVLLVALALVAACGSPPAPTTLTPTPTPTPAPTPTPTPTPLRELPPVEVQNLCQEVAVLAYGEPPNLKPESLDRFVGGGNGSAARGRDGTLPVTLVDDKGNALSKVHVSRRMKKLEIGRSCRTLYAH